MSAVEAGQMSAAETGQMCSSARKDIRPVLTLIVNVSEISIAAISKFEG